MSASRRADALDDVVGVAPRARGDVARLVEEAHEPFAQQHGVLDEDDAQRRVRAGVHGGAHVLRIGRGSPGGRASGTCAPTVVGPPGSALHDELAAKSGDAIAQSLQAVPGAEDRSAAPVVDHPDVEHRGRLADGGPRPTP